MDTFFISYTSADRAWADWIAWELRQEGYRTIHQAWDFRPGSNFVSEMKKAMADGNRTMAVYSPNYFHSVYSEDEWTAAFADRSLLPVRVRECEIPRLLRTTVYIDLLNLNEVAARTTLIQGVRRESVIPNERPAFPADPASPSKPARFPGALPPIWEVPHARNPNFTGRDQMLRDLRAALESGRPAALTQAVAGLGGLGKTQLALEYAYRFGSEYEVVWWMRAEEPITLASDFARLAVRLNLPEKSLANQPEVIAAVLEWLTHHAGWLLIFDNATGPEFCTPYQPHSNTGHILITSRNQAWRGMAERIAVQKMAREEAVAFLMKRSGREEAAAADSLCEALGDLPLALEHAGAYIDINAITIDEYAELYRTYAKELLSTVATTWRISFEKLKTDGTRALDLMFLIGYFAPDNIPREVLLGTAENPLAFHANIEALLRYSLIEAGTGTVSVHRLVQQVTRDTLTAAERERWAEAAVLLIRNKFPDPSEHGNWAVCAKLLSHTLEAAKYAEGLGVSLPAVARLLNEAGLYERQRARLESAEQLFWRALRIYETVYGPDHSLVATCASNLGLILNDKGDLEGAQQQTERALRIDETVYGLDHPNVARDASNLGVILKDKGDLEGAQQQTERALRIDEKKYGPDHPKVAIRANNLGQILRARGDLVRAQQLTERALRIDEMIYGPDHPTVAIDAINLALILQAKGDLVQAQQLAERALQIDEMMYGPDHPNVAHDANNLGLILLARGDLEGAHHQVERAVRILTASYGVDHPTTKTVHQNLAALQACL